jgi:hypothetical protein
MAKSPRPWIVFPHEPVEQIDENLWGVNGEVPDFPRHTGMQRRMCIVRLSDGRLVFYNAIPLDDAALAKVFTLGKPAILIAPVRFHAIDAKAFAKKLSLSVFTSSVSVPSLGADIPGVQPIEELPADPALRWETLQGTRFAEPVLVVQSGPRASLVFCDAFQNSRPGSGFGGFMFKLMGFTGDGPRTPPFYKLRATSDRAALRQHLERLAATPGLVRLVPSHGHIVSQDPARVLRETAARYL